MRALVLTLVAAAVLATAASAHSVLLRSDPADGEVLGGAPSAVRLFFNNGVRVASGNEVVRNEGFASVLGGPPRAQGRVLVLPLDPDLSTGDYSVRWSVVSDDGHREQGVLAFAVGAGRGPPTAQLEAGEGLSGRIVAARALFFAGLLLGAGVAVFRLFVGREGPTRIALLAGLCAAALGSFALFLDAPSGTRFGDAYAAGTAVAVVGAVAALRGLLTAEIAAIALIPVPSVAGHALDPGAARLLELAADIVHVAAASVWVGGVVSVVLTWSHPEYRARFGRLALIALGALAATGLVRALGELSAPDQLVETGYGRALLVKSGLLLAAVCLAWLRRNRAETAVLAAIVVAVAFLTALPPGKDATPAAAAPPSPAPAPAPPRGATVLAHQDGRLAVALAERGRELTATVIAPDGGGFRGLDLVFRSAGSEIGATPCGPGCYRATLPHGRTVDVEFPGSTVRFQLPARAEPAGPIVRRAARVFRGLSSVALDERIASSPQHEVRTRFVFRAPDAFTYANDGGAAGVVLGARRWDREPGGPWVPSTLTPLRVPQPFWTGPVRDVRLLRRDGNTDVVSFYDDGLRAWFEAQVDRATGRTKRLTMITGAHFMHHRYSKFNAPVTIRPPR